VYTARVAIEQLESQILLESADVTADCALRDVQFVGGSGEALVSGSCLESS
jgi:hypothetical protein